VNESENDSRKKWAFLRDAPAQDAKTPEIKHIAAWAGLMVKNFACPWWSRVHVLHAIARDCISYKTDVSRVGREQIDGFTDPQGPADASLVRGLDDCDAKARLFVALCLASNIPAEMVPLPSAGAIEAGQNLGHVYARVWMPRRIVEKNSVRESPTDFAWHTTETILSRAIVGCDPMETPKECAGPHKGGWLYP
jgi:hypothetical protein